MPNSKRRPAVTGPNLGTSSTHIKLCQLLIGLCFAKLRCLDGIIWKFLMLGGRVSVQARSQVVSFIIEWITSRSFRVKEGPLRSSSVGCKVFVRVFKRLPLVFAVMNKIEDCLLLTLSCRLVDAAQIICVHTSYCATLLFQSSC